MMNSFYVLCDFSYPHVCRYLRDFGKFYKWYFPQSFFVVVGVVLLNYIFHVIHLHPPITKQIYCFSPFCIYLKLIILIFFISLVKL